MRGVILLVEFIAFVTGDCACTFGFNNDICNVFVLLVLVLVLLILLLLLLLVCVMCCVLLLLNVFCVDLIICLCFCNNGGFDRLDVLEWVDELGELLLVLVLVFNWTLVLDVLDTLVLVYWVSEFIGMYCVFVLDESLFGN